MSVPNRNIFKLQLIEFNVCCEQYTRLRLDIMLSTIKIFLKKFRNKKIDSQKALRKRVFLENVC